VVGPATVSEWREIVGWTAEEGWNPGDGDAACFHPVDPAGFFLGRLDGRVVTAVSVVNHSADYAFLGYYLVHPDYRGTGLGIATWRAAVPHAGDRTIGLDAVPAQQRTYERSGFTAAHRTLHFAGIPERPATAPAAHVVPVTAGHLPAIAAYDRQCFPAERDAFLAAWLTGPGRTAYVCLAEGRVAGYGMSRPACSGRRIGPLFADSEQAAAALLDALVGDLAPDEEVHLDIPEHRLPAVELAASRGLAARSHTVRMYNGPVPAVRSAAATWGVTSLELG
jgi:GNAT superfamily N-acetyltransferase